MKRKKAHIKQSSVRECKRNFSECAKYPLISDSVLVRISNSQSQPKKMRKLRWQCCLGMHPLSRPQITLVLNMTNIRWAWYNAQCCIIANNCSIINSTRHWISQKLDFVTLNLVNEASRWLVKDLITEVHLADSGEQLLTQVTAARWPAANWGLRAAAPCTAAPTISLCARPPWPPAPVSQVERTDSVPHRRGLRLTNHPLCSSTLATHLLMLKRICWEQIDCWTDFNYMLFGSRSVLGRTFLCFSSFLLIDFVTTCSSDFAGNCSLKLTMGAAENFHKWPN